VRLDHLLSKELHRTPHRVVCAGGCSARHGGAGGGPRYLLVLVLWDRCGGGRGLLEKKWKHRTVRSLLLDGGVGGTLLGPERTTPRVGCVVSGDGRGRLRLGVGCGLGSCGR
jgi:hypothetical protein